MLHTTSLNIGHHQESTEDTIGILVLLLQNINEIFPLLQLHLYCTLYSCILILTVLFDFNISQFIYPLL